MSDVKSDQVESRGSNRRQLLTKAGMVGAAALGTSLLGGLGRKNQAGAALRGSYGIKGDHFGISDIDILVFALNLEYLEANFYQYAAYGTGLGTADSGVEDNNVIGGAAVPFASTAVQQYAQEIAGDELNHVRFLRAALGKYAVVQPCINFTDTFTALAVGAGVIPSGQTFNPFASDLDFLIGSFIFEDVGVTAYHGAAPYIRNPAYLSAAAGILAVEAYHAGEIRTLLFQEGSAAIAIANQISAFREAASDAADSANKPTDQGITNSDGTANIIPADSNSLAFSRTFDQVLNIVYGSAAAVTNTVGPAKGGFFPNGLNGRIA
jgi:hypothetical protein